MTPGWLQAITQAIECGNTIHDRRHQGEAVNYSPREAGAALTDEYSMTLGEELPASLSSLVPQEMTLHHHLKVASRRSERQFAVLTSDTGMSYLIVVDSDNILLVDTHQHRENGQNGSLVSLGNVKSTLDVFRKLQLAAAYGTLTFVTFPPQ